MPVTLSSRERARLKALAHALEPAVRIGHAGVTPELVAEVDRALTKHDLIKVSIAVDDLGRSARARRRSRRTRERHRRSSGWKDPDPLAPASRKCVGERCRSRHVAWSSHARR